MPLRLDGFLVAFPAGCECPFLSLGHACGRSPLMLQSTSAYSFMIMIIIYFKYTIGLHFLPCSLYTWPYCGSIILHSPQTFPYTCVLQPNRDHDTRYPTSMIDRCFINHNVSYVWLWTWIIDRQQATSAEHNSPSSICWQMQSRTQWHCIYRIRIMC